MSDDNSSEATEYGLIAQASNEERYASVLQLARQLNLSPTKNATSQALNLFKALSLKGELLPVALAAGGLVGIAAWIASRRFPRRLTRNLQPEQQEMLTKGVILRVELTQSSLWISSHTIQIERNHDEK